MKRVLVLLAPVALVAGLVACGGDDDSPDTTGAATETSTDLTVTDRTISTDMTDPAGTSATGTDDATDMMGRIFPDLSGDQLDCLVDEVGAADPAQVAAQAQEIVDRCGIDLADLTPDMSAISIPDLGDVSVPDNMDELIKQVFPGLSDAQADCLAEQFGDDFDASKAAQVADTCDIDPSDLSPG